MKILLLDDEKTVLFAMKIALEHHKHVVECANSARQAIPMIEQGEYDFALIDYMMPEYDGLWFMRNAKIPVRTKVLLMTAYVNRPVIDEMFKLGAKGYLIKPVRVDELQMHLEFHSKPTQME